MCTNPKRILNRASHWTQEMPKYFFVPCGECEECRNSKRNDWFVRCYYEWRHNCSSCYFYTLTYNNEHLPMYMGVPHFSKRDVQLFLKRLRYELSIFGCKVRYFLSSEFGEKYRRPHYHILLFFDKDVHPFRVYKLVEDTWQNGFVKYGHDLGKVHSQAGIRYVTKYVTKDLANVDDYFPLISIAVYKRYTALLDYIRHRWSISLPASLHVDLEQHKFYVRCWDKGDDDLHDNPNYLLAKKICNKAIAVVRSRMPFHLQSTKLGYCLSDHLQHDELLRGIIYINTTNNVQKFHLPRCYKRMFWYDVVENELDGKKNKFVLNDLGKRDYLRRLEMSIPDLVARYQSVIMNRHLIDNAAFARVCDEFVSKEDLLAYLANFDLDLNGLAIYSVVFRGRICPFNYDDITLSDSILKDNWKDFVDYCTYQVSQFDYGRLYERFDGESKLNLWHLLSWDEHPFFASYNFALTIFEALDNKLRIDFSDAKVEEEAKARKLRELSQNNYSLFNF